MILKVSKLYSQRDPKWKEELLGFNTDKKYTLGTVGCLVSILATYLYASGRKVDPSELNELLKGVKGFVKDTGLFIWNSLGWIYPEYQLYKESPRYEKVAFPETEFENIRQLAKEGYFVILEVDFDPVLKGEQMHFVGVIEIKDDGSLIVADPWVGSPKELSSFGDPATVTIAYKVWNVKVGVEAEPIPEPIPIPTPEPALPSYPEIKLMLWRALRVFVAGVLGVFSMQFILDAMGKPQDQLIKYVIAAGLAGGFAALGKWLRDNFGNETKSSLVDKLPF